MVEVVPDVAEKGKPAAPNEVLVRDWVVSAYKVRVQISWRGFQYSRTQLTEVSK